MELYGLGPSSVDGRQSTAEGEQQAQQFEEETGLVRVWDPLADDYRVVRGHAVPECPGMVRVWSPLADDYETVRGVPIYQQRPRS